MKKWIFKTYRQPLIYTKEVPIKNELDMFVNLQDKWLCGFLDLCVKEKFLDWVFYHKFVNISIEITR